MARSFLHNGPAIDRWEMQYLHGEGEGRGGEGQGRGRGGEGQKPYENQYNENPNT